jgi:hypothetical protein
MNGGFYGVRKKILIVEEGISMKYEIPSAYQDKEGG